jgi:signal transduction histidine kinase
MKLLTKISLNFLSISLFIFLTGIIVFYFVLRQQVDQNINLELQKRKTSILSQMQAAHGSSALPQSIDQKVFISPLKNEEATVIPYSDTIIFDNNLERHVAYRQLQFITEINQQQFLVKIYKSLSETDNLIVRILLLITALFVALILGLLILNRHTSQKAWQAFYNTIQKIKYYDLNSHEEFLLEESDIKEFNDLNTVLTSMTDRIKNDYYNLKEYTENASHELQTPLAIIISKMELLLQSENLNEKELKTAADAFEASSKLSRLNSTLLLLSKIGNRQFPETEEINITQIIEKQLQDLEELIKNKNIRVQNPVHQQSIKMNRYLAEIMISNLIKNAIRHNSKSGTISFVVSEKELVVANSGIKIEGDTNKLFDRFYTSSTSSNSVGLGLAIVQKICEVSGFKANYSFADNIHSFSIEFKPDKPTQA